MADVSENPTRRRVNWLCSALIGSLQGALFYAIYAWHHGAGPPALIEWTCGIVVTLAPTIYLLTADDGIRRSTALVGTAWAGLVAALFFWANARFTGNVPGANGLDLASVLIVALASFLAVPFLQVCIKHRRIAASHPALLAHAWSNVIVLAAASAFVASLGLILTLLGALFLLAGVDLGTLFLEPGFFLCVGGAVFAVGVTLARERSDMIRSVQALLDSLVITLAPVIVVAAVLFLTCLPFVGLQPLFETGRASVILLAVVAMGAFVVTTVAGREDANRAAPSVAVWMVTPLLAAMPIYVALAGYATGLRIGQYGFTPHRVFAIVAIGAAGLYSIACTYALLRHRVAWPRSIRRISPSLGLVSVMLLLALLTPVVDPYRISADSQFRRLERGVADLTTFDFGFLKFQSGAAGRAVVERIREAIDLPNRAGIERGLAILDAATTMHEWESKRVAASRDPGPIDQYVLLRPDGMQAPPDLARALRATRAIELRRCSEAPMQRCALIAIDLAGDDAPEYVFAERERETMTSIRVYRHSANGYQPYASGMASAADDPWPSIVGGDVGAVVSDFRDLRLGATVVRLTR